MGNETRLKKLEDHAEKTDPEKPFFVVYWYEDDTKPLKDDPNTINLEWVDDDGNELDGVKWVTDANVTDYRAGIDPNYPGNRILTEDEYAELERTHTFLMVRFGFVPIEDGRPLMWK